MTTSRTANLVWATLALLALCLIAVAVCAGFNADPAAYTTIGTIALAVGGSGGVGSVAMGLRHVGAKEPSSAGSST